MQLMPLLLQRMLGQLYLPVDDAVMMMVHNTQKTAHCQMVVCYLTCAPASLPPDKSGSAPCHHSCHVLHMLGTLLPLRSAALKLKLLLHLCLLLLLLLLLQRSSTLPSAALCSSQPCSTG
jgi:hypothetical protein